jgi:hypothetical protein
MMGKNDVSRWDLCPLSKTEASGPSGSLAVCGRGTKGRNWYKWSWKRDVKAPSKPTRPCRYREREALFVSCRGPVERVFVPGKFGHLG